MTTLEFIAVLASAIIASSGSTLLLFRYNRRIRAKEAQIKDNEAEISEYSVFEKQLDVYRKLTESSQNEMMKQTQKLSELALKQVQLEKKVSKIQNFLTKQISHKKYAEKHICLNVLCDLRKPALGEFHTEDPIFQEEL